MPARTAVLLSPSSGSQEAAIQVGPTLEDALRFETTPPLVRLPFQSGTAPNSSMDPLPGKMTFPSQDLSDLCPENRIKTRPKTGSENCSSMRTPGKSVFRVRV